MSKDNANSPLDEEVKDKIDTEDSSTSINEDTDKGTEDSSTSEDSESDISTLDLVKDAIKEKGEDKEDADDAEGSSEKDEKSEDEDESKDDSETEDNESDNPTEDELKHWKPKTRKRFEQLQAKYRDVNTRLEKAEVDAGFKREFDTFLESSNLSQKEANNLFDIGALMKSDPVKALEAITPYYNQLLEITGNVLPRDLQEQVKDGYMTEENAIELSRQRASTAHYQNRDEQDRVNRHQQVVQDQTNLSNNIQTALTNLENSWQTSDPDYKLKDSRIQDRVKVMWFEANRKGEMPRSVEEAVRMVENVKRDVDKEVRQFTPKKQVNSIDSDSIPGNTKPEPKTTLDVIRQTVGG